jgi:hypothetical protein
VTSQQEKSSERPLVIEADSIERLKSLALDKRVFIVGSGPSLDSFPVDRLSDEITICLNDAVKACPCSFWLFGDPNYSRYKASKVLRGELPYGPPRNVVMNTKHLRYMQRVPEELLPTIYWFTNDKRRALNASEEHPSWWNYEGLLPGRWTIATVAVSLAVKLGARKTIFVGVDLGEVSGKFYSNRVSSKPPKKQKDFMGQWVKWMQAGFKRGLWPGVFQTTSMHFIENCPGTPVTKVSVEEAFS